MKENGKHFKFKIDKRMCVRYNGDTNKCSEDVNMQRVPELNNDFLTTLKNSYMVTRSRPSFEIFPQMPIEQIIHYVKQAVRKNNEVIIQLQPSFHNQQIEEIQGTMAFSPRSSQIILTPVDNQMIHLVQPQLIRHLRLA